MSYLANFVLFTGNIDFQLIDSHFRQLMLSLSQNIPQGVQEFKGITFRTVPIFFPSYSTCREIRKERPGATIHLRNCFILEKFALSKGVSGETLLSANKSRNQPHRCCGSMDPVRIS